MNDITFIKTNGGLGRTAASEDPISGLIFGGFGDNALAFDTSDGALKGFDAIPDSSAPTAYVRKFQYVEQLKDAGVVWKEKGESALTLTEKAKNALYYHISEFFRMNEQGTLYVMIKAGETAVAATDVTTLQNYADGSIRQCGIFNSSLGDVADLQEELATLEADHKPMSVVVTYNGAAVSLSTLTETSLATAGQCNVSVLIGCDGDATLADNLDTYAHYGCIGACIGAISKAAVNECIAWVQKFPLGLKVPALFNDQLIKNVSTANQKLINDNRYIFVRTHVGIADNYFNDSHTCDLATSDYAYIENVRTIDKACRGVRTNLLPYLNAPLNIDPTTGQLDRNTVAYLETVAGKALEEMEKAGELSGYVAEIDPAQNVLRTGALQVIIKNVPTGVMRQVQVQIGFVTSL